MQRKNCGEWLNSPDIFVHNLEFEIETPGTRGSCRIPLVGAEGRKERGRYSINLTTSFVSNVRRSTLRPIQFLRKTIHLVNDPLSQSSKVYPRFQTPKTINVGNIFEMWDARHEDHFSSRHRKIREWELCRVRSLFREDILGSFMHAVRYEKEVASILRERTGGQGFQWYTTAH